MTCVVERWGAYAPDGKTPGHLKSMTFHCDTEGCTESPSDAEIEHAGGLRFMGWYAAGGKHHCPKHNPEREIENV